MPPENLAYYSLLETQPPVYSSPPKEPKVNTPLEVIKTGFGSTKKPYKIENHIQQRQEHQKEFLELAKGYAVTHSEKQTKTVTLKKQTTQKEGMYYETENGKSFFVVFPPAENQIKLEEESYVLNGASEELQKRQNPVFNSENIDMLHTENILFFYENWEKGLVDEFYSDHLVIDQPLQKYAETVISDYGVVYSKKPKKKILECGQVDFLGFGPDNQGVIIEFGTRSSEKGIQVQKQTIGVESLLIETNHGLPNPPLTPYIAEYADNGDTRIIQLKQSLRPIPQEIFNSLRG